MSAIDKQNKQRWVSNSRRLTLQRSQACPVRCDFSSFSLTGPEKSAAASMPMPMPMPSARWILESGPSVVELKFLLTGMARGVERPRWDYVSFVWPPSRRASSSANTRTLARIQSTEQSTQQGPGRQRQSIGFWRRDEGRPAFLKVTRWQLMPS